MNKQVSAHHTEQVGHGLKEERGFVKRLSGEGQAQQRKG